MTILEAIILGIIQGLSEFIPISSTAHLTITGKLMGLIDPMHPERWTSFIAVIQLGTLAAVFVYFKQEIRDVPLAWFRENLFKREKFKEQSSDSKMGWYIIIGTIPIVTLGLALKKTIEGSFTKDPIVIASSLIGLAIVLAVAERYAKLNKKLNDITWKDSLIVGFAQVMALIPGSSRSGTTITAGLFLGMERETAARFSFLLSVPAIFGSGMLSFVQSLEYLRSDDLITLIVATIVSGISGYFAIDFLIKFLKSRSTMLFIIYRIVLGLALIFLVYKGLM
jgi:undecaprenyl-diphosphatase